MTTQHTPGTWKVETCDYALATPPRKELKISNSQCYLATLACDFDMPNNPYTVPLEQAQANARLIAAAPELLAALTSKTAAKKEKTKNAPVHNVLSRCGTKLANFALDRELLLLSRAFDDTTKLYE